MSFAKNKKKYQHVVYWICPENANMNDSFWIFTCSYYSSEIFFEKCVFYGGTFKKKIKKKKKKNTLCPDENMLKCKTKNKNILKMQKMRNWTYETFNFVKYNVLFT